MSTKRQQAMIAAKSAAPVKRRAEISFDEFYDTYLDELTAMYTAAKDGLESLGLFREIRIYTLTPRDDGTEFSMVEVFSGPLAGLMSKVVPDMTESFAQFADGLKEAAEKDPADD